MGGYTGKPIEGGVAYGYRFKYSGKGYATIMA